eukprot:PhF_6_TR37658/c0_g1_i1/m.56037
MCAGIITFKDLSSKGFLNHPPQSLLDDTLKKLSQQSQTYTHAHTLLVRAYSVQSSLQPTSNNGNTNVTNRLAIAEHFAGAAKAFFRVEFTREPSTSLKDAAAYGVLCTIKAMDMFANGNAASQSLAIGAYAGSALMKLECFEVACEMFQRVTEFEKLLSPTGTPPGRVLALHCHAQCALLRTLEGNYQRALIHFTETNDTIGIFLTHCALKSPPAVLETSLASLVDLEGTIVQILRDLMKAVIARDAGLVLCYSEALLGTSRMIASEAYSL